MFKKKKRRRTETHTEKCIRAGAAMISDREVIGMTFPPQAYADAVLCPNGEHETQTTVCE